MRSVVASRTRRTSLVVAVAVVIVALDQLTKTWAENRLADGPIQVAWTLRLLLTYNPGAAFSFVTGSTGAVTAAAVVILAVVAVIAWRTSGTAFGVALGLVMGGAVGNLVDRLVRHNGGRVIDFIDLRWWPVFNIADSAITCGVILAILVGGWSRPARAEADGIGGADRVGGADHVDGAGGVDGARGGVDGLGGAGEAGERRPPTAQSS
jgi:signal peptidase II